MFDFGSIIRKFGIAVKQNAKSEEKLSKEGLCSHIVEILCPNERFTAEEAENFICNYAFLLNLIRKDLAEIDLRLTKLKQKDQSTPSDEDYSHKKYRYFAERNRSAKEEIVSFLENGITKFVYESKSYKYKDRELDGLTMLFLQGRYDYAFFGRYYDDEYDYGTEVKFRFIPGVTPENMLETVEKYIKLKIRNPEKYNEAIDNIVSQNDCIKYMQEKVRTHYYLHRRIELFDTLVYLYDAGEYKSFITLAVTQLEGVFYDCLTIMNKQELGDKAGTLVEKADKVFAENLKIKQALYPHFAFSVPLLRNEVAHNGLAQTEDACHLANEISLDLYCIVYWACRMSDDKFYPVFSAYEKVSGLKDKMDEAKTVFFELFSCYQIASREYIDVLAKPKEYETELNFYKAQAKSPDAITIKEMVDIISGIIKSEKFWKYISDDVLPSVPQRVEEKPFDIADFVLRLKNAIIPVLTKDTSEKIACAKVSKMLKDII